MNSTERLRSRQLAHHGEHPLGEVRRQGGGDLVEEQQLRVEREGAGEVEHAQERQRDVAHLLAEVEAVEVHVGEVLRAPASMSAPVRRRFSATVRSGAIAGSWNTGARPRRRASPGRCTAAGSPWMLIAPASARSTPVRILTSVDLPAPLAPSRACTSPGGDRQVDGAQGDDRAERLGDGGRLQQWNGHVESVNAGR